MKLMLRQFLRLLIPLLFFAGCASGSPPNEAPAAQEQVTSAPETEVPVATDAAVPSPASTAAPAVEGAEEPAATAGEPTPVAGTPTTAPEEPTGEPEVATSGRTEDGAYFLGRADAPLTIIDYSDFL